MEDTPHLDIEELYETKQKTDLNRLELYNKLLRQIHTKIKTASRQRNPDNFCSYLLPQFLIGYPNYNISECVMYIIDKLENDNFLTRYIHPNLLLISWNHWVPSYIRKEIKKKTGISVDHFGNKIENKTKISFETDKSKSNSKNIYHTIS